MNHPYDCLVIGAGMAGAVTARELAQRGNKRVLLLERRTQWAATPMTAWMSGVL